MKKIILFNIIILLFNTCDEPENIICYEGTEFDECGVCCGGNSDIECSTGPETGVMDTCGVCFGDDTECEGCTDPDAYNYDSNATISNGDCRYYPIFWELDVEFLLDYSCVSSDSLDPQCNAYLTENTCYQFSDLYDCYWIGTHEGKVGHPIYWLNSSDEDISIYTVETIQPSCEPTLESQSSSIDCSEYITNFECTEATCEWEVPLTYNPGWDSFNLVIEAGTIGYIPENIFIGFSYPTVEKYCALINNEEKCAWIRITN